MCQVKQIVVVNGRRVEVCNIGNVHTPGDKRCTGSEFPANIGQAYMRRAGEGYKDFVARAKREAADESN